jgi:hypothetical protein
MKYVHEKYYSNWRLFSVICKKKKSTKNIILFLNSQYCQSTGTNNVWQYTQFLKFGYKKLYKKSSIDYNF